MDKISELLYFSVVGAQRSGSTYLYNVLEEHPSIYMAKPMRPEPKFFLSEEEFVKGKHYYEEKYFSSVLEDGGIIKSYGEKSTSYIENNLVPDRIKSFYEKAKIIIILRNPIERAISNYFFSLNNGLEKRDLYQVFMEQAPSPEISLNVSVSPFDYFERGNYYKYVANYIEGFGENLKVLIFEEFIGNLNSISELYRFLNVDDKFIPFSLNQVVNESKTTQVSQEEILEVKEYLRNYYSESITKLENLIGRKIKIWYD